MRITLSSSPFIYRALHHKCVSDFRQKAQNCSDLSNHNHSHGKMKCNTWWNWWNARRQTKHKTQKDLTYLINLHEVDKMSQVSVQSNAIQFNSPAMNNTVFKLTVMLTQDWIIPVFKEKLAATKYNEQLTIWYNFRRTKIHYSALVIDDTVCTHLSAQLHQTLNLQSRSRKASDVALS